MHHVSDSNNNYAYFVTESTPMLLHARMQHQYNTKSWMYHCQNNVITHNTWNNSSCDGIIIQTPHLNSSIASHIHNCDSSSTLFDDTKECNLANLNIWSNGCCQCSPYYQLLHVVDVCININKQYSIYFSCDDDRNIIKQDIHENDVFCLGMQLNSNYDYD